MPGLTPIETKIRPSWRLSRSLLIGEDDLGEPLGDLDDEVSISFRLRFAGRGVDLDSGAALIGLEVDSSSWSA